MMKGEWIHLISYKFVKRSSHVFAYYYIRLLHGSSEMFPLIDGLPLLLHISGRVWEANDSLKSHQSL